MVRMPDISTGEMTEYWYFCAKPKADGWLETVSPRLVRKHPLSAIKAFWNSLKYKGVRPIKSWAEHRADGWRLYRMDLRTSSTVVEYSYSLAQVEKSILEKFNVSDLYSPEELEEVGLPKKNQYGYRK